MTFLTFRTIHKDIIIKLTRQIVLECINLNIPFKGPINLPKKVTKWTVLRSPHIDKKSREQFELREYYRMFILLNNDTITTKWLKTLNENLPSGIEYKIKIRLEK